MTHSADITIATIQVPPREAGRFGVLEIDEDYRVMGFEEKPQHGNPARSRFDPSHGQRLDGDLRLQYRACCSRRCTRTAQDPEFVARFRQGCDPAAAWRRCRVIAYDFRDINAKQSRYWRDVGTLDAFYEANMDLVSVTPEFNLYDQRWPIRTKATQQPPAKFVFAQEGRRMGVAHRFHRVRRLHRFGRPGGAQRALAGRARQQLLRSGVFDPDARRGDRPVQPHPPRDRRIPESRFPELHASSASTRKPTGRAAITVTEGGITVVGD